MRIESIELCNFKSIGSERQSVNLAPITLLFGPNSVGKSTILQALVFLREVIEHKNLDPDITELGGEWLNLGGFINLVHGRDPDKAVEISVNIALREDALENYLSDHDYIFLDEQGLASPEEWLDRVENVGIKLFIAWSEQLERPQVDRYEVSINKKILAGISSTKDGKQIHIDSLNLDHEIFSNGPSVRDDETGFSGFFNQFVDSARIHQPRMAVDNILSGTRPFREFKQIELEEFVDSTGYQYDVLKAIKSELVFRTTRSAHDLSAKIDRIMEEGTDIKDTDEKYIGIFGQKDALVQDGQKLQIDPDIWAQDTQEEMGIDEKSAQLLITSVLSGLMVGPIDLLSSLLNKMTYIGPLRDLPDREMTPQRTPDISRWAKGLAAWELLYSAEMELVDEINKWLGIARLNTGYEINIAKYRELGVDHPVITYMDKELEADDQAILKELLDELPIKTKVTLKESDTDMDMMPQDVGVGISQLLPVVILSIYQKSGIVSVEQPELHIHPRLQVELADLFISHSQEEGKIFLLETHSEHLILRLLRRIREYHSGESISNDIKLIPEDHVSVVYVETTDDGAKLTQQAINENGDFNSDWPDGFFEERDEELFF